MEYDRHRTRWTHIAIYLIYVSMAGYLLLKNNPYLYSHKELRLALAGEHVDTVTPVPKGESQRASGNVTFWTRQNAERTGQDLSGNSRDKDYLSDWQKPILDSQEDGEINFWAFDTSGFFFTGTHPWALALSPEGDLKWRFRFANRGNQERGLLEPVTDEASVYLTQPDGQIAGLEKSTGRVIWMLKLGSEILAPPVAVENELILPIKPLAPEIKRLEESSMESQTKSSKKPVGPTPVNLLVYRFARINRLTGELIDYSNAFQAGGLTSLTYVKELNQIFLTNDNKIVSLNLDDKKTISVQTLPDPIKGPAVYAEGKLFVSLASGKVQAWDMTKKGKFEWEVDLGSPPASAPTYVPFYQRLTVMTTDSQLHMIDIKKAEHLWRFPLENKNPSHEIVSARLKGSLIEKLSMKWEKKGWTIWSPCSENRLCIYNPEKGQLISRIPSSAGILTAPFFNGKEIFMITVEKKNGGHLYNLAHFLDEETFKKKAKATADAAL